MNIFSNDYLANFSNKKLATGGPARFAKEFSDFAVKQRHNWNGLCIIAKSGAQNRLSKKQFGRKTYWQFVMKGRIYKQITKAKSKIDVLQKTQPLIDKISALLKKTSADIVFLNGFSVANWIIMQAAFSVNKKIVIQHAGIWTKEVNMYRHFFSAWGRRLVLQMEKDVVACVDHQIFLNEYSRDVYSKIVKKVSKSKSLVIPLPFLGQQSRQVKFKPVNPQQALKIGIVARWDRIKNQEAVLALAKEIKKQNLNWQIYSVTVIPETKKFLDFKKQYRSYIKVIPPMPYQEIPKFNRMMDLMILPSHFDVSPNVVMEAANEGLATLISPYVGWVNEYRRSGCSSLIVDFAKPEAVIKEIKRLSNPQLRKKIKNMFVNIRKKHDKNKIFAEYLKLFKTL